MNTTWIMLNFNIMNILSKGLALFSALCISVLGFAQKPSTSKKAQVAYENASKSLSIQKTENAIQELKKAIQIDPYFATAYQQLADIYRSDKKFSEAIPLYRKVLQIDPALTSLTYYGLGQSLLGNGEYKEALINLERYSKENLAIKSRERVNKYIQDCQFALNYQQPISGPINRLPFDINTTDDEYFPKLTADGKRIIFTRKTNNQENFFESILTKGVWSKAEKLLGAVNSDLFNEGAHCVSPDGKYLFFTGCNRPNGMGSCDIYVSKRENGEWTTPHNLGAPINTKGWEAQPAISSDGRTLYFVSNRPGGFGGSDIWKSRLNNEGKWLQPENLGPIINSSYDERSPYIHADNKTLYFASEGWPGFGQFDLFKSQIDSNGSWSTPVNMGPPINNNFDQTAIHVSMNGNTGYFSSADSSNQLDIYSVEIPKSLRPVPVVYIQGRIFDSENKEPLSAQISVTNTRNNEVVYLDESDYLDGLFIATLPVGANYAVHIQKQGYMLDSKQYDVLNPELENEVFERDVLLYAIKEGRTMQLNNIYFDTDSYTLLGASEIELNVILKFLRMNPNISIEVGGHTDSSGDKVYNKDLSEHRAQAVASYLISKGISGLRVTSMGYGDNKPIGDNSTPMGRQLNRRTEIKIR